MPRKPHELSCERRAEDGGPFRQQLERVVLHASGVWADVMFCCRYWNNTLDRWDLKKKARFVRYRRDSKGIYRVYKNKVYEMAWSTAVGKVAPGIEWAEAKMKREGQDADQTGA